jgi:hypothetical protein
MTAVRASGYKRLLAAAALCASSVLLQGGTDLHQNLELRVLAAHNRERSAAGIGALEWDDDLAADAAEWGAHLRRLGYLEHYPDDPEDEDPQGENLWAGTSGYYSPEAMVGLWIDEKKSFRPGVFPANSRTGNLEDVGHYTQLMWRSTRRVGCAKTSNGRDDFLVCRYSEGGNVIGERPF